jgi:bla regulator protein blaR1
MIPEYLSALGNHIWQSTIVVAAATLLALMLRNNSARVRYCVWFVAAMKFLIPFSLFVMIGHQFEWRAAPAITQRPISAVVEIGVPFNATAPVALPLPVAPKANPISTILIAVWLCGFLVSIWYWVRSWLRVRNALKLASSLSVEMPLNNVPIPVLSSPKLLEPAVFGIIKPVLVLPHGLSEKITPEQLKAILVHELCHVWRRDNLTSAIYMGAETLFWFYPLVHWIGKRLMDERERACDEEVLRIGQEPDTYVEGILTVCKLNLESAPTCAAGVMGSDLKKRVKAILENRAAKLNFAKKLMLAASGLAVVVFPLVIGAVQSQSVRPRFEAASIKVNTLGENQPPGVDFAAQPGGRLHVRNNPMQNVIRNAYGVGQRFLLVGGPDWIDSDRYDMEARAEGNPSRDEMMRMLQALLEDRLKLQLHRETREVPVYDLTVAKGGPKLTAYTDGSCINFDPNNPPPPLAPGQQPRDGCGNNHISGGRWTASKVDMGSVTGAISAIVRRKVIDKTALTGLFNVHMELPPDPLNATDPSAPSIFTLLEEQLGLKLESSKGPAEVLVIDRIERPSEN